MKRFAAKAARLQAGVILTVVYWIGLVWIALFVRRGGSASKKAGWKAWASPTNTLPEAQTQF